jgi:hypothetical protein
MVTTPRMDSFSPRIFAFMAPTLADFFGANAAVDTSTPANPKLTIQFSDFATQGFSNTAKATDPEAWVTAIVKKIRAYSNTATDESSNIVVDAPFKGLTTRNSLDQREYSYSVRIYEPDTGSAEPDPDNV